MSDAAAPRQIAVVRTHDELHAALRARADQLGWTRTALDDLSGLANTHVSKLLAPVPIKRLGRSSLGPLLGAMGLVIIIAEDAELLERMRRLAVAKGHGQRNEEMARNGALRANAKPAKSRRGNPMLQDPALASEFGRIMRARQLAGMTPAQRRRSARWAARSRQRKLRAREPANSKPANSS